MAMAVLVGYATAHGSTRGVAERIGERLRQHGIAVDVRPLSDVGDLGRYDAVVLGSAVHGGKWLPPAKQFVDRNALGLRNRPSWLFSVSTLGDEESMFGARVAKRLRALRKETPEITGFRAAVGPREHRNFAGAVDSSHWPASGRASFRAMGGRYGDHRNWPAIEAWADRIAVQVLATDAGTIYLLGRRVWCPAGRPGRRMVRRREGPPLPYTRKKINTMSMMTMTTNTPAPGKS